LKRVERIFPNNYRAAEGHFPGNPIIPGASLLSEVLLAIEAELGVVLSSCHVKAAKFFHPVRPGDCVSIEFTSGPSGDIKFTCAVAETMVLSGQVKCGV